MAGQASLPTAEFLIATARAGDEAGSLKLLDSGANANFADAEGKTALHWAASKGLEELCRALLQGGASVDSLDVKGFAPLHWAACNGHPAICRLLVEGGADIDPCDVRGVSPLFCAACLVAGARPLDSLIPAIIEGCRVLMQLGARTDTVVSGITALHFIAAGGIEGVSESREYDSTSELILQMLLDGGALVDQPDQHGRSALFAAVGGDNIKACRLLLARGADVNHEATDGETPLLIAALLSREEIVKLLIESGAKVNHVGEVGILQAAASKGHTGVCRILLDSGADINHVVEVNALHAAASSGHTELCQMLLERGADVESLTSAGATALCMAAMRGHTATCKLLLEKGASVDRACCVDGQVTAPVVFGAYGKGKGTACAESLDVVKLFLDHGVDYKVVFTAAVERNDRELIEVIVLHPSFDATVVHGGALLRNLLREVAEWRSMPNNLQDALVNFAGDMVELQRATVSEQEPESESYDRAPTNKRRRL